MRNGRNTLLASAVFVPQQDQKVTTAREYRSVHERRRKNAFFRKTLTIDTKNWFDRRMPQDSLLAEAHCFATSQRIVMKRMQAITL
jgi:hypothetical protein